MGRRKKQRVCVKSYRKDDGKMVKGYCYDRKDVGKKGRGKKVIPITRKGALKKLGYSTDGSATSRHMALAKAVKKFGYASVRGMLGAQVRLRKSGKGRVLPKGAKADKKIFQRDYDWLVKSHGKG